MEKSDQFVKDLHERQEKDEANRAHQGKGNPGKKSPSKTHKG
ncbi:DUF4023 domain-containing protein [Bacillus sp. FJAT-42376]|nr:DUF4023 family protein [Bacillus sp. FJAT-42376]AZB43761.1 DUF4023 domain-containing protein [Bacillus sp. FJAT-42376]